MSPPSSIAAAQALQTFFSGDNAARAMKPLANGIRIAVTVDKTHELLLTKMNGKPVLEAHEGRATDVQFHLEVPVEAALALAAHGGSDVPTIAVALVNLFADATPERRIRAGVYAGPFELLRKGYLSVIPLGGAPLMRALAERGVGSISEIREKLKRLKENR